MPDLRQRLSTALGGRYRLLRELGRGGAAVIYLAEDLKHDRKVALKVLRPDLAASLGTDRFLREIKIAAQLAHPHILPLHDSGEAQGFLYYVMPVVEGESLQERLRDGPMPVQEAVALLHDVFDALQHAHHRGVVHRDIKPGNVMLSGRHALVTDFGVAKALAVAAEGDQLDTAGVVLGTPAYMAPEQATADPGIDHRADIYAVGVLAYEMLTGRTPFGGGTAQAVLSAQVAKDPDHVLVHRPDLPPELADMVMKCLEKNPADRWQEVDEAVRELDRLVITPSGGTDRVAAGPFAMQVLGGRRGLAAALAVVALAVALVTVLLTGGRGAATGPDRPVVVVLPFQNLGPPEDEFFANGVTDAITARLATLGSLGVISRTSAMQFRESELSPREIGAELGADYVLEGTVQRERPHDPSSRVRIIPQLIRASDDTHVWASVYDEDMTEVFRLQSEIADRVVRAMDVALLEGGREPVESPPTADLQAYELYLRGHDYLAGALGAGDANARRIAIDFFEQAIDLDPGFALAWAELSTAHIWLYHYFVDPSDERLQQAKAAVDTALALDPALPGAHLAMGLYHYWGAEPDRARALEEFQHVVEREPSNAYARTLMAVLQAARGEWDEAVENAAMAAALDPRDPEWAANAGVFHMLVRRYADAARYLGLALGIAPDMAAAHHLRIALYLRWQGDTARAHAAVREMLQRTTPGQVALALVEGAPSLLVGGTYDSIIEPLTPASVSGPLPFDYYYLKAEFYRMRGRLPRSRAYYDSLRTAVRAAALARAGDPTLTTLLARAEAGLGRRQEAMAQAALLEREIRESGDALLTMGLRSSLVWTYAMLGEVDAALDHLGALLASPSMMSTPYLQVAQFPEELRRHQRFRALLGGEGVDVARAIRHGVRLAASVP
ncbi:MAG: protein kinase [Gemmatimonadota bacterium]|nr:MAG: protein kinase [Gemmatimonadota bacterium]